jgi:ribosome-associated protein
MMRGVSTPRVDPEECEFSAIRAQGAGGQNVNKVSNAVHLRFDIGASSLPEELKQRLRDWPDQRIGSDGVVTIKAQEFRSLARNQAAALARLQDLVDAAAHRPRQRVATRPTRASRERRLDCKARRGTIKSARGRVDPV